MSVTVSLGLQSIKLWGSNDAAIASNIQQHHVYIYGQLSKALQLVEDEDDAVLRKELEAMILEQDRLLSPPTVVNETPR